MNKVIHKEYLPSSSAGVCSRCKRPIKCFPFYYESASEKSLRYCPKCRNGSYPGYKFYIINRDFFHLPTPEEGKNLGEYTLVCTFCHSYCSPSSILIQDNPKNLPLLGMFSCLSCGEKLFLSFRTPISKPSLGVSPL